MVEIKVSGYAKTSYPDLQKLVYNVPDCQDIFSDYFDYENSYAKSVSGGYMDFEIHNGKILTIVRYISNSLLSSDELKSLLDYTSGQLSDGIGEGFEQMEFYVDDEEVYLSPHGGGEFTIVQETTKV